jgi:hypothetical protein
MSADQTSHLRELSAESLRRVDRVCEAYEADVRPGVELDIDTYVTGLSLSERAAALRELRLLGDELDAAPSE